MPALFILARLAAVFMLLWAVAPQFFQISDHPYSFFELLRVAVCAVCAFGVYCAIQWKQPGWAWAFGSLAALVFLIFEVRAIRGVPTFPRSIRIDSR